MVSQTDILDFLLQDESFYTRQLALFELNNHPELLYRGRTVLHVCARNRAARDATQ